MEVDPAAAVRISTQKARYGRFADTKQWSKFKLIALPDAEYNFYDTDGMPMKAGTKELKFTSTDAFTAFFLNLFERLDSLHMFGPGEFEQTGPDEIKAIWAMQDQIIVRGTAGMVELRGGGHYHEVWQKKDGDWFLKSLNMYRTYTKTSLLGTVVLFITGLLGLNLA